MTAAKAGWQKNWWQKNVSLKRNTRPFFAINLSAHQKEMRMSFQFTRCSRFVSPGLRQACDGFAKSHLVAVDL
jgi:hypothetical protein